MNKFYIENEDEPKFLWHICSGELNCYHLSDNHWEYDVYNRDKLDENPRMRRITKREAKSLFPLAFPPHTKEGK